MVRQDCLPPSRPASNSTPGQPVVISADKNVREKWSMGVMDTLQPRGDACWLNQPPWGSSMSRQGLGPAIHGLFMVALVVSMSWKNMPHLPVEADLWVHLPEPLPVEPAGAGTAPETGARSPPPRGQAPADRGDIALKKAEQEKNVCRRRNPQKEEAQGRKRKRLARKRARRSQGKQ